MDLYHYYDTQIGPFVILTARQKQKIKELAAD